MRLRIIVLLLAIPSLAGATFIPGPIQVNNGSSVATSVGYGAGNSSVPVQILNTVPVSGTFWQSIQPVSQSGPFTISNSSFTVGQTGPWNLTNSSFSVTGSTVNVNINGTVPVSGTFWQTTQPVSIAAVLPVSQSGPWYLTTSSLTVGFGGTAQPVTSTSTNVSGSSVTLIQGGMALLQANGAMQVYQTNVETTTITGVPNVNVTNLSSVTFNGVAQPVTTASTITVQAPNGNTTAIPVSDTGLLADNGASTSTNRVATLPGYYTKNYGSASGTAGVAGKDAALEVFTDHALHVAALPAMLPASYVSSTGTIVPSAQASGVSDLAAICGNPTTTVLLTSVRVSCTQTTAGIIAINLLKRSSVDSGVIATTMTSVAEDSNYTAAGSSVVIYGVNPSSGTLAGILDSTKLGCMATGTASPNDIYISPSDWKMKPQILRGANQCVAVNLGLAAASSGASFGVTFDWLETATITP